MKSNKEAVSIIGAGSMARGLGTSFLRAGTDVTIFHSDPAKAIALSQSLQEYAQDNARATGRALGQPLEGDIVIPAVPYEAVAGVLQPYKAELPGKIVIEISNPIASFETFKLATKPGTSAAENIAKVLPNDTKVVKAFNTTFAGTLVDGVVGGEQLDVFIASDHQDAKQTVSDLVRRSGMRPVDAGPLKNAQALEGIQAIQMDNQSKLGTRWKSGLKIIS